MSKALLSEGACHYYEVLKSNGSIRYKNQGSCFRDCQWDEITELRHLCVVRGGLSDDVLRFWIRFLRKWLVDLEWTAQIINVGGTKTYTQVYAPDGRTLIDKMIDSKPQKCIFYRLKTCPNNKAKNLLYATAFRYPQKYSAAVQTFYNERKNVDDPEELFRLFQEMHIQGCYSPNSSAKWRALSIGGTGEDLISINAYHDASIRIKEPLTLETIRERIKAARSSSVYAYWAPVSSAA